ncbi:uncharacterized protein LOC129590846 [Paramacrobiotus metropolitanus]|uniref:uncharacterized protein LOC129590846 n=1 Tax=Paramacrobiotus metropolitanus TaxID=2943436 RepID=UPI002445EC1C|nr:uncharacterized protein LOC129590846 [Paramacrobiotus metropolitanus]
MFFISSARMTSTARLAWLLLAILSIRAEAQSPSCAPAKPASWNGLTGEALYKQVDRDYATYVGELSAIASANVNKPLNNDTGLFLTIVIQGQQNAQLVGDIASGKQPVNEANCLTISNQTVTQINGVMQHANDVIPGATCDQLIQQKANCDMAQTGLQCEGRYQYILQQLGQVFVELFVVADANANATNPGKYLNNFLSAARNVRIMQSVVAGTAGPFNATACELTLNDNAAQFQTVLNSLTDVY